VRSSAKPQSAHFLRPADPTPGGRAVALQGTAGSHPGPSTCRPVTRWWSSAGSLATSRRAGDLLPQCRRGDGVGTRHPTRRGSGGTQLMAPLTSHLLERCDPFHRVHVNGASSKAFASSYPGKEPPVMVTPVVGAVSGGCHRSGPRYATEHQNAAYTGSTGLISITTPPPGRGESSERFATSHGDRRVVVHTHGRYQKGDNRAPPCPFGPPGGILPEARLPPTRTDSHRWTA
jgi:hypothetical protein